MNTAEERKQHPVYSGVLKYFPKALLAVANCSWKGNEQHNPGEQLYWNRAKSTDEADALVRHLLEAGKIDKDGVRHTTKVAWRALALLEKELEQSVLDDLPGGCMADWGPGEEEAWQQSHEKEKAPSPVEREPVQLKLPFDDPSPEGEWWDVEPTPPKPSWWEQGGLREAYGPPLNPSGQSVPGARTSGLDTELNLGQGYVHSPRSPRPGTPAAVSPPSRLGPPDVEAPRPGSTPGHRCERPATSPEPCEGPDGFS